MEKKICDSLEKLYGDVLWDVFSPNVIGIFDPKRIKSHAVISRKIKKHREECSNCCFEKE